jgi:hypothetical protein
MGSPQVPFDPTGNPFPKKPPTSGETADEEKEPTPNNPVPDEEELS